MAMKIKVFNEKKKKREKREKKVTSEFEPKYKELKPFTWKRSRFLHLNIHFNTYCNVLKILKPS